MTAEPVASTVSNDSPGPGKEAVRVVIQARPLLPFESAQGAVSALHAQPDPPCVTIRRKSTAPDAVFRSFDAVYPPEPDALPDLLYTSHVTPLLTSVFSGVNATVFAYGQTSAGKSYTMRHITNRVAEDIFTHKLQIERNSPVHVSVRVSFVEVYKDVIRDLVDGASAPLATVHVHVRERITPKGRVVFLDGAKERVVDSEADLLAIIKEAALVRRTAATGMNASSSRSHSIITLSVIQEPLGDPNDISSSAAPPTKSTPNVLSAKLHLVDLAGSERAKRTAAAGERFAEGVQINRGLFALAKVISVLAENSAKPKSKHRHVPYRDSKLTRLLQDSLGGNARTLLIACVSPADSSVEESLGTLRYAQRARRICNKPTVNTDPAAVEVSDLRAALSRARAQISALVADNERLRAQINLPSYTSPTRRSNTCCPSPTTNIPRTPRTLSELNRSPTPGHTLSRDDCDPNGVEDSPHKPRRAPVLHATKSLPKFVCRTTPTIFNRTQHPLVSCSENTPQSAQLHISTISDADGEENEQTPFPPPTASSAEGISHATIRRPLMDRTSPSSLPKRTLSSRLPQLPALSVNDRSESFTTNAVRRRARSAAPPRRAASVARPNKQTIDPPKRNAAVKTSTQSPVRAAVRRGLVGSYKDSDMGQSLKRKIRKACRRDSGSLDESEYSEEVDSEDENDANTDNNDNAGLQRHVVSALSEARVEQMRRTFTERLEQAESDKAALDKERSRLLQDMTALREKHSREVEDLKSSHVSKLAAVRAKLAGVKRLEAESIRQSKLREGSDAARKRMQGRITAAEKAKEQVVERMSDALARADIVKRSLGRENRELAKSERSLRHEVQRLVDAMARIEAANAKLRTDNESLRGRLKFVSKEPGLRRTNSTFVTPAHSRTTISDKPIDVATRGSMKGFLQNNGRPMNQTVVNSN